MKIERVTDTTKKSETERHPIIEERHRHATREYLENEKDIVTGRRYQPGIQKIKIRKNKNGALYSHKESKEGVRYLLGLLDRSSENLVPI